MLETISKALENAGLPVWYGAAKNLTAGDVWNYIVFYRTQLNTSTNKTGFQDVYQVAIVCEDYVPDETIQTVLDCMLAIPGMKLTQNAGTYQYTRKPNTDQVVELLALDFVRPSKVTRNGR